MGSYREIKGDLIKFAKEGHFDVIGHGCNCFCTMEAGLALQMVKAFGTDQGDLEQLIFKGEKSKLGNIEILKRRNNNDERLFIVNMYTQYKPGKDLSYKALLNTLQELNRVFANQHIGLPQIGCGIAGGDWEVVSKLIRNNLKDCKVTIVIYDLKVTEYEEYSVWNTLKKFVNKFIE